MASSLIQHSGFPSITLKMTVLEDFEEDSPYCSLDGVLKKGDVREFDMPDGRVITFGKAVTNTVVTFVEELDD